MNIYENKETIVDEVKNVVISLVNFYSNKRSPFDEVVLFVKESMVSESRQVVLTPDQSRRIAMALIKAANIVDMEWQKHRAMINESVLHSWEDEGGASGT